MDVYIDLQSIYRFSSLLWHIWVKRLLQQEEI